MNHSVVNRASMHPLRRLIYVAALTCALLLLFGAEPSPSPPGVYEELLEQMGVFAGARASAQGVVERLRAENPVVPAAVWASFAAKIADREVLVPLYVPIYVRHLTEADARELLVFYRSTLGSRWLEAVPKIQQECRVRAEVWAGTIAEDLLSTAPAGERTRPGSIGRDLDPRRARSIEELLRVSGALAQARQSMNLMIERLQQGPQATELPAAFWQRARERLSDETALMQLWSPAYAQYLSDDDVRGLIAFYRSPPGERYVAALPAIQSESVDAATRLANASARRAVREVLGPLPQWRLQHPDGADGAADTQKPPQR